MVTLDKLRAERRAEILILPGGAAPTIRGSSARQRAVANEKSDLDLLVDREPGRSLLDHAGLAQGLEELLGVRVQVGTENSLHWYARARILREATRL